jgi:hypothetical protein
MAMAPPLTLVRSRMPVCSLSTSLAQTDDPEHHRLRRVLTTNLTLAMTWSVPSKVRGSLRGTHQGPAASTRACHGLRQRGGALRVALFN